MPDPDPNLIPHSRPTLPEGEEWEEVTARLAPGWAADGPCVARFEQEAAPWLGCRGGVAVSSGTNALHLALAAVGVGPGSEVLVPAYCCAALLNAVAQAGAEPVLVDTERGGVNLCPEDAARRLTGRTAAIVVAHMFGRPAPLAPFLELGPPVVEDCAQSLGAAEGEVRTGGRGAAGVGSFYATKVITTGHGGMAVSRDPEVLARLRDLVDYDNREEWRPRFSYRMGETAAALGLWQLERLPGFLRRRREVARRYDALLFPWWDAPSGAAAGRIDYRYVVRVPDAAAAIPALRARGVDAKRPVYRPLHHYLGGDYPGAQAAHDQFLSLPLYPALSDEDAARVAEAVRALRCPVLPV